ncbi:aluminum-activated malate transporter 2-like [Glycine soja]|uniref:Aluminum-activated malate transporter 2 isoform A n=1 Tax=Glycine soja TaxID=3848 RepID=A0A445HSA4_GLYSO|nr:aluminum-activated malate transporter 2-like [Glycine soja]RZB76556.1 Aluminum-activated malate transporter 2 isoform A [Glycine soja]
MASVNGNNEGGGAAGARVTKFLQWLMALPSEFSAKVVDVMSQIKKVGKEDPRRVIHALKVALSITLVSAFYYVNPLYDGFGSSAMYAVFTVIVVSEFSVGATLGKGLNRGFATFLAGALGLGSYYLVHSISTEHIVEPILLGTLIYLITAGITYFRFLPQIKARYDYGLLVFNLTFCLVSVSSYRDHEVLDIALKRVISIISGGLISVSVSIFVCPIWAGGDLHNLESKNIEKLGNFLEGFGEEYFGRSEGGESNKLFIQGYKSVLTSKQVEETFANFARWEPCHGRFRFRHPWQQYLKIGNLSRQCAYRIDALNGFLNSAKTPLEMRGKIPDPCIKMSTEAGKALKELAMAIHKMIPPSAANPHIAKSKIAATNLRSIMKTGLWEDTNLFEVIPVLTVASLLLHVVSCTEKLAESIQELSTLAKFKNQDSEFVPKSPQQKETPQPCCHNSGPHHVVTIN